MRFTADFFTLDFLPFGIFRLNFRLFKFLGTFVLRLLDFLTILEHFEIPKFLEKTFPKSKVPE